MVERAVYSNAPMVMGTVRLYLWLGYVLLLLPEWEVGSTGGAVTVVFPDPFY